jgi:preprotein translocase subunit SecG
VTLSELVSLAVGVVQGLGAITVFLLVLFIGVCVGLTLTKFRSTRNSLTVKSLDELVGEPIRYLPPNVPRGPSDQLAGSRR